MSAPAVPHAASSEAPTTKVDSTAAAPHGPSISSIGNGGASSIEGPIHTGMFNNVDQFFYHQFLSLASFIWTTTQNPGTKLWSTTISPKHAAKPIRHLAKIYNTWTGGFDFNFKICGTGFHAGAIMIVRFPPNVDPNKFTTLQELTMFEYQIIDPKTLEIVSHHTMDQRRIMYHYVHEEETTDAIGGYIGAYVYAPLNTSSTGATQISVQVLSRLAPDFLFSQPLPLPAEGPIVTTGSDFDVLAESLSLAITSNARATAAYEKPIDKIVLEPSTVINIPNTAIGGSRRLDGTMISKNDYTWPMPAAVESQNYINESDKVRLGAYLELPEGKAKISYAGNRQDGGCILEFDKSTTIKPVGTMTVTSAGTIGNTSGKWRKDGYLLMKISEYIEDKREFPKKMENESYVTFSCDSDGQKDKCLQPDSLASLLATGMFKNKIKSNEALIFDIIDKEEETPIYRFKLSFSGIITTKAQSDQILLPANKYIVKFVQVTKASEPIPAPPQHQQQVATLHSLAFTTLKQSKQLEQQLAKWQSLQQSLEVTSSQASGKD